ncbi:MAG: MFS transporter, partial [Pseudomonadota bacterium]
MTHPIHDSRYSWLRLLITLAIAAVANVGMWAVIVVMPAIETQFGAGRAEASMPYTLAMIGFALGNMWLGQLVDRMGVTVALIGAAILSAASYGLATLAPNIALLSLAHLLLGLGTAVGFAPLIADISHWFMRRRGIAVALVASGNYLSGAIWPTVLSGILARDGWQQVYLTLAVITLAFVVPMSLLLRRQVPAAAHNTAAAAAQVRSHSVGISPRALQYLLG